MPTEKERFGKYIRERRLAAGLSLRELGERLGLSHVFVGEVERGKKSLPQERWGLLCDAIESVERATLEEMAASVKAASFRRSQLTLTQAGPQYQRAGELLLRRARDKDLPDHQLELILQLLEVGGE